MLMYFIGDIKITIAHRATKFIKYFYKYMINASQWDKKVRHKPTSAILWRLPAGRILRRVLQVTQVLYSPLHLG